MVDGLCGIFRHIQKENKEKQRFQSIYTNINIKKSGKMKKNFFY